MNKKGRNEKPQSLKPKTLKPKTTPIYQTSVFTFDDLNELETYFEQPDQQYMYSRYANPNSDELAQKVCELEAGDCAVVTSSGTSAILTAILTYCQSGDHVLCAEDIYGGTATLLTKELSRIGIEVTYIPTSALTSVHDYVQDNTKMLLAETMTNPLLRITDIEAVAAACHKQGVALVIDNTFATPILTKPLQLGADMVIHSVTKFLAGHSDVTAGVVIGQEQYAQTLHALVRNYGLNLSPFESWLAARGLKTLRIRMQEHSHNALHLAQRLNKHPQVKEVFYPGLPAHPDHQLALKQCQIGFGGMLSFKLENNAEVINRFIQQVNHFPFAPSLAGVDSSLSHPLRTSHRFLTSDQQLKLGITEGLIRLSVGIEELSLLEQDLIQALDAL